MTASGATDGSGSGLVEYMYFVDNKAGASDTVVKKTVGTDSNPNVASFTATMGRYLGQVAVVDKAGNVSNVQGDPDARTKMYSYKFSKWTGNLQIGWSEATTGIVRAVGYSGPAERLSDNIRVSMASGAYKDIINRLIFNYGLVYENSRKCL